MKRYLYYAVLGSSLMGAQPPVDQFSSDVRPFLVRNCQGCHNAANKTGGLAVDQLTSPSTLTTHADEWEKILRKVKTGEMPPAGFPKPKPAAAATFTHWAETELDRQAALRPDPGRVTLHRLNRTEYNNAVQMFPTSIVASMMNLQAKPVLETAAAERQNVNVGSLFKS